jgi:dihydropteroate synthase
VRFPATTLPVSLPCIMGIVNVTPDSFSDGGRFFDATAAVDQARRLVREGAAIVDVGGESTRPGAEPLPLEEELRRVIPVIESLREVLASSSGVGVAPTPSSPAHPPLVSIDTYKGEVARRALAAGATVVNDISALRLDPGLVEVVAETGCPVILMHMLGEPRTMQDDPRYGDVVDEVCAFLEERLVFAVGAGVREEQVLLDPGIGFGKTLEHNLLLLRHLDRLAAVGRPLVLGASRKRFLGALLGGAGAEDRLNGTVTTTVWGLSRGVAVFRVHDVRPSAEALRVAGAIIDAGERPASPVEGGSSRQGPRSGHLGEDEEERWRAT